LAYVRDRRRTFPKPIASQQQRLGPTARCCGDASLTARLRAKHQTYDGALHYPLAAAYALIMTIQSPWPAKEGKTGTYREKCALCAELGHRLASVALN